MNSEVTLFKVRWAIFMSSRLGYADTFANWCLASGEMWACLLGWGGQGTLSADTVNLWSCMWSCGWACGVVASLGSVLGFLLQRKHRHVTSIMTYIKTFHYVSHRQRKKPGWNVTFPLSADVWRWHHVNRRGRLPLAKKKKCGSLIAAPGFGCSHFANYSHSRQNSVDKRVKVLHVSHVFLFSVSVPVNKCWLDDAKHLWKDQTIRQ